MKMDKRERIKAQLEALENRSPAGFAIAFHIRLTSPDFLFQTYPKSWTDTYSEKGYVMVDPIVRWGFSNIGAIRWSALDDLDDHNIIEQSHAHGMAFGVAIATETEGSRSVAGFSRADREYTDAEIDTLTVDVQQLHALTETRDGMPKALRDELHKLSVVMTHNSTSQD